MNHGWVCCAGNTRVITQSALQTFQEEMKKAMKDPYKVVLNQTKLPISLLSEKAKVLHLIISNCLILNCDCYVESWFCCRDSFVFFMTLHIWVVGASI